MWGTCTVTHVWKVGEFWGTILFFHLYTGAVPSSARQAEALAGPSGFHFSCVLCVCSNGKNKCRTLLLSKKTWNRHNFNEIIKSSDFLEVLSHSMWHWLMWLLFALYGSLSGMLHLKPFHQSNRWEQKYVWWSDKVHFFPYIHCKSWQSLKKYNNFLHEFTRLLCDIQIL